jgi:uncharacterized protein involved in response to NO
MLFGYAVAVIAGFLLTAVRNWTGMPTWTGTRLGLLAAVWLSGRLAPWMEVDSLWLVIGVDVLFLPLLALSLVKPLWAGKSKVNRVFLLLLSAMALANLLSHLQLLGMVSFLGDARKVMVDLILLLIVLVAGRVLPFFTQNVLPGFKAISRPPVENASIGLAVLLVLLELVPQIPPIVAALAWLAFGLLQAVRLSGWFDRRVFTMPVLWVLHIGYVWLIVGALLKGLSLFGLFPAPAALHALTAGVIGVFTLGMMARVARGHTGRPIEVSKTTATAFVLLNLAGLIRVFGTAWLAGSYALWVDLSAALWIAAFALFVLDYAFLLLRPRVDGKPG